MTQTRGKQPQPHHYSSRDEYILHALIYLVDTMDRIVLPALEDITKKETNIMATQAEFKQKLQDFFRYVETAVSNVQQKVDDAIAAHEAGDSAAFDSLSQDVADEMTKLSTKAEPVAQSVGLPPPAMPESNSTGGNTSNDQGAGEEERDPSDSQPGGPTETQ